ncbi:unnamed protein product [Paramecium primaurelia]|uniref:B box-type domain-containing protein n=1 Tax=Paramecium primaurelia TaxID=5886 RepID=A0A8S1N9A4_PARPR|nr:unnamed protein product [Paramecium primaurelia]
MFNIQNSPNPSEIGQSQTFQLQAPCMTHQGQSVTNFCKQPDCLMPLCPKCIPQHLDKHRQQGQFADLITIDEMHEETLQLINTQLTNLNSAIQLLQQFKDSKTDAHGKLHTKLSNSKLRVQQMVDQFFEELFNELDQVTQTDKTHLDVELQQMERSLNQKIQEYQQIDQKLRTPKYLKQIIQLQTTNFLQQTQQQRVECEAFIEEVSKHTLDIQIDEQELYFLKIQLAQYASIKNAEYYKNQQIQSSSSIPKNTVYNHPYLASELQTAKVEQSPYKRLEQQLQQVGISNFTINLPDFYDPLCNQKYLHYFTDKSIFILNLEWIQNPRWQEIRLNCQVPIKSTSVRSQQGDIFVIGGYIGNQLSSQIFRLDFKQQTLISTDQLTYSRHSSAGVFLQNKLYVLGGQNQSEDLTSIESLELQLNKSRSVLETRVTLPKMNKGGPNLSICTFRQYIIKATPLEIFDTKLLKWISLNHIINKGVGMVAINNSNVLIFGGGQYQLLKMVDQQNLSFVIENLPNSPQFGQIQNGSLIHQGKIYAVTSTCNFIIGTPDGWTL